MRPWLDEFAVSMLALVAITLVYALVARDAAPSPSSPAGLGLGIAGFVLMLAAETLYSARKRLRRFHLGSMAAWLQGHVLMGLCGSYLVLLHSAGKFRGLAGALSLVTAVTVASGFVGRYLYTELPRTLEQPQGAGDAGTRARALALRRRMFALWHLFHVPLSAALFVLALCHIVGALYYTGR